MVTHFAILAWEIPQTEEPGGVAGPGFPGTPQDEAGLPRKFETSPVGCVQRFPASSVLAREGAGGGRRVDS